MHDSRTMDDGMLSTAMNRKHPAPDSHSLLHRSVYPAVYFMPPALLAACGYTAVRVNFRGSQGFGEDNIQSLPGNVGVHDVADCMAALDAAVAEGETYSRV